MDFMALDLQNHLETGVFEPFDPQNGPLMAPKASTCESKLRGQRPRDAPGVLTTAPHHGAQYGWQEHLHQVPTRHAYIAYIYLHIPIYTSTYTYIAYIPTISYIALI